ncbi:glutamate receptor ionotropic, delta-2-like, partial [Macrobrachium nipponense]|uniref:glutamate receptor ionotropic, delta-2-like n=1 Tax=Macrobrachium nipponense TaxID=159736 RepID=UPI0030C8CC15
MLEGNRKGYDLKVILNDQIRKAIYGESTTVCRVYVIDLTVNENNTVLEFLEISQLWLWPEAKVVIAGIRQKVGDILFHSVFRNTYSIFYLGLSSDYPSVSVEEKRTKTLTSRNQLDSVLHIWVFGRCLFCNNGKPKVQFLSSWSQGSEMPQLQIQSPRQIKSLEGHLVRMVSIVYFPYVDYEMGKDRQGSPVTLRDSLDKRIFEVIASCLNFTYEVRAPSDLQWGALTESGNWTGMLGSIQKNKADMTTVIALNPTRLAVIDVTRVYQADKMTIVSLKPQLLPQYLVIIRPFT